MGHFPGGSMGLRDRLRGRVKKLVNQFSGEHSAAAPEEIKPFERDLAEDPDAEVLMARLNRPKVKG